MNYMRILKNPFRHSRRLESHCEIAFRFVSFLFIPFRGWKMKKRNDQDVFGIAFDLCDHRSAAFRQKMFTHFHSSGNEHWTNVERIPERKKNEAILLFKESA